MAKKKIKKNKLLVKLVSGAGTGYFYLLKKTPATATRKVIMRKFDPIVNQYVIFNEARLKFSTTAVQQPIQTPASMLPRMALPWQKLMTPMTRYTAPLFAGSFLLTSWLSWFRSPK